MHELSPLISMNNGFFLFVPQPVRPWVWIVNLVGNKIPIPYPIAGSLQCQFPALIMAPQLILDSLGFSNVQALATDTGNLAFPVPDRFVNHIHVTLFQGPVFGTP